ncbi:hypothetical protein AB0F24_25940 [Streptomyces platensis]|uniref:hypothetical protein n=1 Tax=Streptomyces platensis TaxID=58346 RepID=UPI0033F9527B
MEADNLTTVAMQLLTAAATGTGTGIGDGVAALIRQRLGGSQTGAEALARFERGPTDPDAAAAVRGLVGEAITADPVFAEHLERASSVVQSAAQGTGNTVNGDLNNVSVTGGMKGNITIGPVTMRDTPGTRAVLVVVGLLLAVLLVLGTYGGVRLLGGPPPDGNGQGPASPTGASQGPASPPGGASQPLEQAAVTTKDLSSTPFGWLVRPVTNSRGTVKANTVGAVSKDPACQPLVDLTDGEPKKATPQALGPLLSLTSADKGWSVHLHLREYSDELTARTVIDDAITAIRDCQSFSVDLHPELVNDYVDTQMVSAGDGNLPGERVEFTLRQSSTTGKVQAGEEYLRMSATRKGARLAVFYQGAGSEKELAPSVALPIEEQTRKF